ncbi:MAG TPA: hypothetical protein VD866_23645 [Urbifossiella sp.]|nr:hypothetical protein [Urbifossiella sp.]
MNAVQTPGHTNGPPPADDGTVPREEIDRLVNEGGPARPDD